MLQETHTTGMNFPKCRLPEKEEIKIINNNTNSEINKNK